jgi:hypothetical protein
MIAAGAAGHAREPVIVGQSEDRDDIEHWIIRFRG